MGFFLSPIKFVFELIGFLLSAAFVYGLALIAAITLIFYGISTSPHKKTETIVETVMTYVEGMVEYAESYRGEINSVVERVTETVEGVL